MCHSAKLRSTTTPTATNVKHSLRMLEKLYQNNMLQKMDLVTLTANFLTRKGFNLRKVSILNVEINDL